MTRTVVAAAVQTDPKLGDVAANLEEIVIGIGAAEADLVVFPECALTGYGFESREQALAVAQEIPGPATEAIAVACSRTDRTVVVGLLEVAGDRLYNAAAVIGPTGLIGVYRKNHLPFLGVDRFVDRGDLGYPVFDTSAGRLGVLICYDLSFPEACRTLKLDGAQIVCVPTNWPLAAEVSCVHAPPVRAQENHVHLVIADRVGQEAGFTFRGESRLVDCDGRTLAGTGTEPAIVIATIDPAAADANLVVHIAGGYELDRIAHRRPETYGRVVRP